MGRINRLLAVLLIGFAFVISGCAITQKNASSYSTAQTFNDRVRIAGFESVKINEVKKVVGNGVFTPSKGIIVDARPEAYFDRGHIPSAINIPSDSFGRFYPLFEEKRVPKDTYIIVYCDGLDCMVSVSTAKMLRDKGYTNIKIYSEGMPDWKRRWQYIEIGYNTAAKMHSEGVLFVDTRPERLFKQGTISGSINLPDSRFVQIRHLLPADKSIPFVAFCAGLECVRSHAVAGMAKDSGYEKIYVYGGGLPEWNARGGSVSVSSSVDEDTAEGRVDKDYFKAIAASTPPNVTIVDVRTPEEFNSGHIEGAVNIDVRRLDEGDCEAVINLLPSQGDIVFHCAIGMRSESMYFGLIDKCGFAEKERLRYYGGSVKFSGSEMVLE